VSVRAHGRRRVSQLSLRLLEVKPHVHLAVHRRSEGEVLARLLVLSGTPVELAEAEVTVGDERAHAELAGADQRLAVVAFGVLRAACRCVVTC
jgi:hypothetical protein